jgi:hypothetical protein
MNEHGPDHPLTVHSPAVQPDYDGPATPVTEEGIRAFFNGLAALEKTLTYSYPGRVAVAITPSLAGLIAQFCRSDPRYGRVMANTWVKVDEYFNIKNSR